MFMQLLINHLNRIYQSNFIILKYLFILYYSNLSISYIISTIYFYHTSTIEVLLYQICQISVFTHLGLQYISVLPLGYYPIQLFTISLDCLWVPSSPLPDFCPGLSAAIYFNDPWLSSSQSHFFAIDLQVVESALNMSDPLVQSAIL